jgi:hypothetical protein
MRFFNPQIRILWNFELRTQRISQRYLPHSSSASRLPWPHRSGPKHLRWFWSFAIQGPMTRSNRVATFEEAKAQFQKAGKHGKLGRRWKRWMTRLEQRRRCVRVHGRHGRRRPGCSGVGLVLNGPELRYHLSEWRRSK